MWRGLGSESTFSLTLNKKGRVQSNNLIAEMKGIGKSKTRGGHNVPFAVSANRGIDNKKNYHVITSINSFYICYHLSNFFVIFF